MNENHYPPLPGIVEAIQRSAAGINRYPDLSGMELAAAVADRLGVPAGHVVVGPGSVAVCLQLLAACAGPGAEVVHAWPSFEAYSMLVRQVGATPVRIPLRDHTHDLEAMAAAVTDRTRVVFVCNPNNPTGTAVRRSEIQRFLANLPPDLVVVVDEAYRDFADNADDLDALELHRTDPRVCVLRTFSKSHGLAGLRVGYLVAHDEVVSRLRPSAPFFSVNTLGQVAATAALESEHDMRLRCATISAARTQTVAALRELNFPVPRSEANFIWLPLGPKADGFAAFCADQDVLVRVFPGLGVRVTIAEDEANSEFLNLAEKFSAQNQVIPEKDYSRRLK